jgi:hypothetical protein
VRRAKCRQIDGQFVWEFDLNLFRDLRTGCQAFLAVEVYINLDQSILV